MFNEMAELENLDADEVSLVPQGANRKRFIIRKEGELEMDQKDTEVINEILETEFEDEERFKEIAKESKLSEKATKAMKAVTRILQAFKAELPKEFLSKLSELAGLTKAEHEDDKKEKEKMSKEEIKTEEKPVDTKISKEDLEKVSPVIKEKLEAILKSNDDLAKSNEAIAKENGKLSETVKEEKNARILKEFKEEAQSEYSHISTSEDLGPVLKEMKESLTDGSYEKITAILKEADVISKKSEVFKEYGSSHSEGERTLRVNIEKGKQEIRKTDSSLSDAQAEAKYFEDNPQAYTEYLEQEDK